MCNYCFMQIFNSFEFCCAFVQPRDLRHMQSCCRKRGLTWAFVRGCKILWKRTFVPNPLWVLPFHILCFLLGFFQAVADSLSHFLRRRKTKSSPLLVNDKSSLRSGLKNRHKVFSRSLDMDLGGFQLLNLITVKLGFKELFGHHKKFLKVKSSLFQTFNKSTIYLMKNQGKMAIFWNRYFYQQKISAYWT